MAMMESIADHLELISLLGYAPIVAHVLPLPTQIAIVVVWRDSTTKPSPKRSASRALNVLTILKGKRSK
jgi:hypothetical protein